MFHSPMTFLRARLSECLVMELSREIRARGRQEETSYIDARRVSQGKCRDWAAMTLTLNHHLLAPCHFARPSDLLDERPPFALRYALALDVSGNIGAMSTQVLFHS